MNAKRNDAPAVEAVSETELSVLKVLWEHGAGTIRQIDGWLRASEGRDWAYTTIQTLLHRLVEKRCVAVDRGGFAHVFHPALSKDEFLHARLSLLSRQLCDGTAAPLMLALARGEKFSPDELRELRGVLDGETPPEKTDSEQRKRRQKRASRRG